MVLKRLFGRSGETQKRKRVTCDELSRYLNIEDDAVWKKEDRRGGGGSFLDGCIKWSFFDGCGRIGKNHYSSTGIAIHIRNLEIELEADGEVEIRYGCGTEGTVDLSFENCFFTCSDVFTVGMKFIPEFENTYLNYPYSGGIHFTFSKNTSDLDPCSFSFPGFSEVTFSQNDFKDIAVGRNDGEERKDVILDFMGNKFGQLDLDFSFPFEYPVKCNFFGNEIDFLNWDQMVNRRKPDAHTDVVRSVRYDDVQEYNWLDICFRRNKIISGNRDLFVLLRKLAIERKDIKQEKIIDSHIDMVDYTETKKSKWSWRGINEEWIRLGWCWWSSRFYMSWLWPVGLLILGYLIFNAIPMLWVDGYSAWEWVKISTLSPKAIYDYAGNLELLLEPEVTEGDKIGLRVVEWGRWIWIILCVFAFRNAIKKK